MANERSLILLKPDCLNGKHAGEVIGRFEKAGFEIRGAKLIALSDELLKEHYAHIADLPFFPNIIKFMSSRPVLALVLEGENAIAKNREIMGATNPANADQGTIRKDFAESIEANSVHGSDSPESAAQEISYFFSDLDIVG